MAKKMLSFITTIVSVIVIIFNLYILYQKLIVKKNLVSIMGYSLLTVTSGSMEPTIQVNDLIMIKKENDYLIDDIVTYQESQSLITHRIVGIVQDTFYTKGDSNNTEDKPIQKEQIQGKVIHVYKGFGNFLDAFLTPAVATLIVSILYMMISKRNRRERK